MTQFIFKMPDLGEGTVEAEIVAWHTGPGAVVKEDEIIVEVMTDKAAVEVPAPVGGRVVSISGAPGDKVAVGAPLIVFDLSAASDGATPATAPATPATDLATPATAPATPATADGAPPATAPATPATDLATSPTSAAHAAATTHPPAAGARLTASADAAAPAGGSDADPDHASRVGRVKASPADRRRAREAGIDLQTVVGSGPGGRILRGDLAAAVAPGAPAASLAGPAPPPGSFWPARPGAPPPATPQTTDIKIIGVRRIIAERMSEAKRTIPHFAYVEEVDVTELESLRLHLNAGNPGAPGLTYLPLVVMALTRALESFPQCNVVHDAARGVLVRHAAVHVGIATQTPDGLKVPVVHNAQALSLWTLAAAIRRAAERARTNQATRDELKGSTITVTSLGKLGGIASTPVINAPEVAIIGLNKAALRPVVQGGAVVVRLVMNLSSSFDHRFVDGYDAAAMIQALKDLLEHPATIFIPKVNTS